MPPAPSRRVNHDAEIHARFFEVSECGPLIIFYYIWMFPEYALAELMRYIGRRRALVW